MILRKENKMKKITLRTIKKFIKDNKENLYISNKASFNGMTDGVEFTESQGFKLAENSKPTNFFDHSLGIKDAFFAFNSRDYFDAYTDENFNGYEISNCCGKFILAVK